MAERQWVTLPVEVPRALEHVVHGPRCLGAAVLRRHARSGQLVPVTVALSRQAATWHRMAPDVEGSGQRLQLHRG